MSHRFRPAPEHRRTDDYVTCACCGKRGYLTKADARRTARLLYPGQRLRPYRCGEWWHVTSQSAGRVAMWRD